MRLALSLTGLQLYAWQPQTSSAFPKLVSCMFACTSASLILATRNSVLQCVSFIS